MDYSKFDNDQLLATYQRMIQDKFYCDVDELYQVVDEILSRELVDVEAFAMGYALYDHLWAIVGTVKQKDFDALLKRHKDRISSS